MDCQPPQELQTLENQLRSIIREHHKVVQRLPSDGDTKNRLEQQKELESLQQEIINVAYRQKQVTEKLRQSLLRRNGSPIPIPAAPTRSTNPKKPSVPPPHQSFPNPSQSPSNACILPPSNHIPPSIHPQSITQSSPHPASSLLANGHKSSLELKKLKDDPPSPLPPPTPSSTTNLVNMLPFNTLATALPVGNLSQNANTVLTTLPNGTSNLKLANGKPALFIIKVPQGQSVQPGQPINIVVPAQLNNSLLQKPLPMGSNPAPIITRVLAQSAAQATGNILPIPSSFAAPATSPPLNGTCPPASKKLLQKTKTSRSRSPTPTKVVKLEVAEVVGGIRGVIEDKQGWFLAHLGLCTRQRMEELEKKRSERRRRKTANPQFSSAALEEKKRLNELLHLNKRRGRPRVVVPEGMTKVQLKEKLELQTEKLHKEKEDLLKKRQQVSARLESERERTRSLEEQQRSVEEKFEQLKSLVCFVMENPVGGRGITAQGSSNGGSNGGNGNGSSNRISVNS